MIKFLQGIALILFAALCILGIQKYSSITNDAEKEPEDPITEEAPEQVLTFTVNNVSYEFEAGMTWEDWVNSHYNTLGAELDGDYGVCIVEVQEYPDGEPDYYTYNITKSDNNEIVLPIDLILKNCSYYYSA